VLLKELDIVHQLLLVASQGDAQGWQVSGGKGMDQTRIKLTELRSQTFPLT
jgi:hypothetical protein